MNRHFLWIFLFVFPAAMAQLPFTEDQFLERIKTGGPLPEKLLGSRAVVFYPYTMSTTELEAVQRSFQKTGIDAVVYFENDLVAAGRDAAVTLADYLNKREISNMIYFRKDAGMFRILITAFNGKANFTEQDQTAWADENRSLEAMLQGLYRTAAHSFTRENFLINDFPETAAAPNVIHGRRNEFFAIDLKVDELAVPKFGDPVMDQALEELMKSYPYKYKLTEPNLSESELRRQGFLYVLRFVHARNRVIRNLLGYDMSRAQSAIVSITHIDGQQQLRNFSVNEPMFKFYFKHIESANVFLGTKWDADPSWEQALKNQLSGFKIEFNIN